MGAISFIEEGEGLSAEEAFNALYNGAIHEYGNDPYSGTIATTELRKCVKRFAVYKPENEIVAQKIIDDLGNGDKWESDYIDLGVCSYITRRICKTTSQNTGVYAKKYVVFDDAAGKPVKKGKHYDNKSDANAFAMQLSLKSGNCYTVKKIPVLISGSNMVSKFKVNEKKTTEKPKCRTSSACKVFEIHKYLFFGWAAD